MGQGMLVWIGDEALLHNLVAGFPTYVLFIIIAVCLLLLIKGANWMIDGAVALARRTGLPRIVIGATIISLGTTTPEAVVSVMAAWLLGLYLVYVALQYYLNVGLAEAY